MTTNDSPTPDSIVNADSIPDDATTVIIAGSRSATDILSESGLQSIIDSALSTAPFEIDTVVSGTASGVDTAGEQWANNNDTTIAQFPADWDSHGRAAGPIRNETMAEYASAHDGYLLAIIDYPSSGTESMIRNARDILGDDRVFVLPIGESTDEAEDRFSEVLID